jgi:hypothetical protein
VSSPRHLRVGVATPRSRAIVPKDAISHGPASTLRVSTPSTLAVGVGCGSVGPHRPVHPGRRGPHESCAVGRVGTVQAGREQISTQQPLFCFSYFLIIFKSLQVQNFVQV